MESAAVRLAGAFERSRLEALLHQQIVEQSILRLKGRAWLPGKLQPLQIQAVGPRLECWFDPRSGAAAGEPPAPGLELVALGLSLDGLALERALAGLLV